MTLPEEALLNPENVTHIPAELLAQAMALNNAVEAHGGLGLVIMFQVPDYEGPGVPLLLAGDAKAVAVRMLGTAIGLCNVLGAAEVQAVTCDCPKCRTTRAKVGQA